MFIRTVRSTVGGFPNNVSHMSSGKILATVLNVRSVRIDDQFKTFICECSQYWHFMTSMALIQYKTYICGMFCCYFLLYINIFFSGDSSDSICWSGGPWCRLHLPIKLGTLHERSVNILYLQESVISSLEIERLRLLSIQSFPELPRKPFVFVRLKSLH